ncbi:MAG: HAMP domain-containing sensor histidine kinase [Acidobacteriota bacterium]
MSRQNTSIFVIYLIYLAALAMTSALLVFWVLVVQRFYREINQLVSRLGVEWSHFHWFVGSTGAVLIFLVSIALTYLLAITLSERRYRVKQDHFFSTLTHELKSPLAAIQLHAQTLEPGDLEPEAVSELSGVIVKESQRIGKLVDHLLESSRLAAGAAGGELEPIDLQRFFSDYQDTVHSRFDLRAIRLRFEIETRAVVMATPHSLHRVMDNLIDNAIRFTDAGGDILCSVHDLHDDVHIVVADTGIGIPKTELTKVFDRFHRLQREIDSRRKGTGLGLAIVRGLVREMRGRIRAFSGDGEPGTRFEIHLPHAETRTANSGDSPETTP